MSAPGTYIRRLRQERNIEAVRLADLAGVPLARQQQIEDGSACPTPAERRAYAGTFGFASVADFDQGWRGSVVRLSRGTVDGFIPVISLAPAGPPGDYEEVYPDSGVGYAYIDPPPGVCGPNLFAFVIVGDSMEPDFPSGHFAICRPTPAEDVPDGQAAFVRFGAAHRHTCTFKRCYRVDRLRLQLRAINPAYRPTVVAKEDVDRLAPVVACVPPSRRSSPGTGRDLRYFTGDAQTASDLEDHSLDGG